FPILSVLAMQQVAPAYRGRAISWFTAMFDLGNTLANPILGAVAEWAGYPVMFTTSGLGVLFTATAVWRRQPPKSVVNVECGMLSFECGASRIVSEVGRRGLTEFQRARKPWAPSALIVQTFNIQHSTFNIASRRPVGGQQAKQQIDDEAGDGDGPRTAA